MPHTIHLAGMFAALSNPTRFAIVERLAIEGELTASEIASDVSVTAPAMSRHFRVLCDAGILEQRVDAQRRFYSVKASALDRISDWMRQQSALLQMPTEKKPK